MRDDDSFKPSLLLAKHEHHAHHIHFHDHNHKRQTGKVTATASSSVVTQVTATISVVQQVDVDGNGSTFSVFTVPETSTGLQAVLTGPSAAASSSFAASSIPSQTALQSSSSQSATTASTSIPSTSSFASLLGSSNSTTLISSSSSLSHAFANSSSLSSRSSFTYLTSSPSSSSSPFSSSTSLSSSSSAFTSTSFQSTSTGAFGGAAGGTAVSSGTGTSSTAASGNGPDTGSGTNVSTSKVVGGVVGSVAGIAVIALLLLFIVKWRKNRNGALLSLGSGRDGAGDGADMGTIEPPSHPAGGMVERRSLAYAVPAALASLAGLKRSSRQTDRTVSSTAGSERGFYRVSGRKLPSVLQSGGDGYGGGIHEDQTLSGSSFYRDSQGFYGGPGTPTFPPLETHRESGQIGTPIIRPSPARTPVTEQGPFASPDSPPLDPLPPPRPDVLGRSHPSQDGSHASRFTEEV